MVGQRLPQEADGTDIEVRRGTAVRGAQAMPQEPGVAEPADEHMAARIDGSALHRMRLARERRIGPSLRLGRKPPVRLVEEGPFQAIVVSGHQSPSKTGFCFFENAS